MWLHHHGAEEASMFSSHTVAPKCRLLPWPSRAPLLFLPSPAMVSGTFSIARFHPHGCGLFPEYPGLFATSRPTCSLSLPLPPLLFPGLAPSYHLVSAKISSCQEALLDHSGKSSCPHFNGFVAHGLESILLICLVSLSPGEYT